ncbi:MAG: hypothetical protein KFKLKKLM_00855 [Flavobacteriales bacterium]|nr:hypothetical protein [Flavobacteriales bacterium]
MKMSIKSIALYLLISFSINATAQYSIDFSKIESLVLKGDFHDADSLINFSLLQNPSVIDLSKLYQAKGSLKKLEGNIDAAHKWWQKSNEQRILAYPKHDYHLAWNYALLSNFHYEKINRDLARTYADSCLVLIQNLTDEQQKELEIYKIWNILGQSIKLQANSSNLNEYDETYAKCFSLYQKSVDFQLKYNTSKHNLAKTYHLIGNANIDMALVYNVKNEIEKAEWCQQQSLLYHNKAINIWHKLYGSQHYELAKTLFVMGLSYHFSDSRKLEAVELFRKSCYAFGLDLAKVDLAQANSIPNKGDMLMCMKYYTLVLMELSLLNPTNNAYLKEATKVNAAAIYLWEQLHQNFKGSNTNQNLAIYQLIPHQEQLAILMLDKKIDVDNEIFLQANEKLKYYDLFKEKQFSKNRTNTIEAIQKKLHQNQMLLDFHFSHSNQEMYFLQITKDRSKIITLNRDILKTATTFNAAIADMNYEQYTKTALELYSNLFPNGLKNIDELIICPDAFFGDFPFEALLCSDSNIEQKDYRKLDYLINKITIQYVLTPSMFTNKIHKSEWDLSVFAPSFNSERFVELPFSQKMGQSLVDDLLATGYVGEKATKKTFQQIKSPIVHLSSHAIISDNVTANFIQMTDGAFYQNEISRLSQVPNIVVLNACNSGMGKKLVGDGINGFVRELHKIGVNATLSNLWEVDDKISNELLLLFYKELYTQENSTNALRNAKLSSIKSAANSNLAAPYYWAGHQLVGENVVFEVESDNSWWWLIGIIVLTIAIFLGYKNLLF